MKYIKFLIGLIILLLISGCSMQYSKSQIIDLSEILRAQNQKKKLTLIVYMAADNDLESYAIANLKQMEHSNYNNMNVLVLLDRASGYDQTNDNWEDTRLFEIKHDSSASNFIVSERLDCQEISLSKNINTELDMANYNVLRNLINFAKKNYEAEKYAVIIWGHGTGWRYVFDSNSTKAIAIDNNTDTYMSVVDEGKALRDFDLSVIGFDTCFGGCIENVYELRNCSTYTVASPNITPSMGWNYQTLLENLSVSDFSDSSIAQCMADSSSVSISIFDNSKINDVFDAIDDFSRNLALTITNSQIQRTVLDELRNCMQYRYSTYPCDLFLDLYSIASFYESSADSDVSASAISLMNSLNNAGRSTGSQNLQIGIYFINLTESQVIASEHNAGYRKNGNDYTQCEFIKQNNWWVPTFNGASGSLLDILFYKVFN